MNLDEYRALKAASSETPVIEQTPAVPVVAPVIQEVIPAVQPAQQETQTKPNTFEVDGEAYTPEQIKEFKAGYLRTQDYTKKTQEAAQLRREAQDAIRVVEQVRQNPQLAQQFGINTPSAEDMRNQALEDQLVQREVELLSIKYTDFNVQEALNLAATRPGLNLEDAYLINKSSKSIPPVAAAQANPQFDIEDFKKQIRDDLVKEFEKNQTATQSIITSNDGIVPTAPATPVLSEAEREYCRKSRTSEEAYIKMKTQMRKR